MKRRMITPEITSQGKFLRMSLTAQALYMHLLANADDDGCVDAYTITRLIGAKEDDLVLLKEREYVTILDEHEWILWITGWQDFNWIDARYKEDSKYLPLLRSRVKGLEIIISEKSENNKRRYAKRLLEKQIGDGSAHGQNMGTTGVALAKDRIGKDRINNKKKLNKEKRRGDSPPEPPPEKKALLAIQEESETSRYWEETLSPLTVEREKELLACLELERNYGAAACVEAINTLILAHSDRFSQKQLQANTPRSLARVWDKLVIYRKSKQTQYQTKKVTYSEYN